MPLLNINKRKKTPTRPYEALASFYDHVMAHVDYDSWANYVIRLAQLHGFCGRRIIDISCGTGMMCGKFVERNFSAVGVDISKTMLKQARGKKSLINSRFICGDMRSIPLREPADLAVSLYDSMNYLLTPDDWIKCLNEVYRLLQTKGLFIFDVSTVFNSEQAFKDYHQEESTGIGRYTRKSVYQCEQQMQYNYFEIIFRDAPKQVFYEHHEQRIRYIKDIQNIIAKTLFRTVGCYSDFSLHPASEAADRVHFVLQR